MKQRTFLTTLALSLIFFNLGIFVVSVAMFRDTVNRAKDRSLGEHYFIVTALTKDLMAMESRGTKMDGSYSSLFQTYAYLSGEDKVGLVFYKNNQLVFSSKEDIPIPHNFQKPPDKDNRLSTVRKIDGRTYVIVSGRLPDSYSSCTLIYIYDTTEAIHSWHKLKNQLFFAGFILSVGLAFGLLLVLNKIFKPLKQISIISRNIADGAYETRLPVSGHDELTEMSQSFNHMAEEIQNKITQLKDSADQKQQFVDNFAHELRTPLTAIFGYAEYLQKAVLSDDDKLSALNYIMSESRRLQTVAYQLLEMANFKNNPVTNENLKVSDLFETVRQTLCCKLEKKELQIEFSSQIEMIYGDSCLMESLLINLIDNAIKACHKGGSIIVRSFMEAGFKTISVQDNGKGMTQEVLSQITEPFYRGEKSRNRNEGGAGLGLALCKQIAESHSAKLSFYSRPGEGTIAKITFTTS
jgi:Signal transduction histidine kinase